MKMKKILCAVLACVLAFGMLAGCGGNGGYSEAAENFKDSDETLTLKWLGYPIIPGAEEEGYSENLLEETFNVEIQPLFYEENKYNDKKTMLMAGGEIPDLIYELDPLHVFNDVKQDFIVEVPYETIEKYAPEYFAYLNEYVPVAWIYSRYEDANWGLPNFNHGHMNSQTTIWRKDWLDKVGLDVPKTLDDMHEAFTKFVNEDPDGNGKKDTYGMSVAGGEYQYYFSEIFGAYGCLPFDWQEVDGKIVYGGVTDDCKEALKTLATWYSEGLIHPDFVTGQSNGTFVSSGTQGYTLGGYMAPSNPNALVNTLKEKYPESELAYGFLPVGPDGESGTRAWGKACHVISFGNTEGYGVKVPRILKMIEGIFTDFDLGTKVRIGEEGTHWNRDVAADDMNAYAMTEEFGKTDASKTRVAGFYRTFGGPGFFAPIGAEFDDYRSMQGDQYKAWAKEWQDEKYCLTNYFFKIDVVPSATDYIIDLRNKQMAIMSEIIMGKRPVDDYEEFIKLWENGGGKIMTEEANALKDDLAQIYKEAGVK